MEENFSSEDDIKDPTLSPKKSGKKLKLNDGSSQDSLTETRKYDAPHLIVTMTYELNPFCFVASIWKQRRKGRKR